MRSILRMEEYRDSSRRQLYQRVLTSSVELQTMCISFLSDNSSTRERTDIRAVQLFTENRCCAPG